MEPVQGFAGSSWILSGTCAEYRVDRGKINGNQSSGACAAVRHGTTAITRVYGVMITAIHTAHITIMHIAMLAVTHILTITHIAG